MIDTSGKKFQNQVRKILETPFWPEGLQSCTQYFRTQDDCDGDMVDGISVIINQDGDVWLDRTKRSCRFRVPLLGGGNSPRVRNALLLLALAIKMDNDEEEKRKLK